MTVSVLGRRLPAAATYMASLGAALLLLLLTIGAALWQAERSVELNHAVRDSLETRSQLRLLLRSLQDAETSQRGYLLTGDETYLRPYLASRDEAPRSVDALARAAGDDARRLAEALRLRELSAGKFDEIAQTISLYRNGRQNEAMLIVQSDRGKELMDELRGVIAAAEAREQTDIVEQMAAVDRSARQLRVIVIFAGLVLVAIGALLVIIVRNAMRELRTSRDEALSAHERLLQEMGGREQAEAKVRQMQKMDAIGQLTGGVAHDFNNLLAAILGNLALARTDVGPDHLAQESLAEIHRAAIRARQLVQQILAFSRRQTQELQRQPLQPLVEDALRLLRSLLPAGVRLSTRLSSTPLPVLADATQIQQVLMNLCTNAWQAMGSQPGEITVALRPIHLDASQALQLTELEAGSYACLSVADDGPGMDEATQRRIFEPFFTTKAPGSGTGLGLSVVHGIVKAHRGAISVHSGPGEGARFDVFLPQAFEGGPSAAVTLAPAEAPAPAVSGRHIVYVDDYEALVYLAARLLRKQGYRVSSFVSGEQALEWMRGSDDPIDLMVTDQNMPGMTGVELAREARALRPGLRVAIVSGHVNEQLITAANAAGVAEVLGKQDSMDELAEAVRGLIEEGPQSVT